MTHLKTRASRIAFFIRLSKVTDENLFSFWWIPLYYLPVPWSRWEIQRLFHAFPTLLFADLRLIDEARPSIFAPLASQIPGSSLTKMENFR